MKIKLLTSSIIGMRLLPVAALIATSLAMSACQKDPEPVEIEAPIVVDRTQEVATTNASDNEVNAGREVNLADIEDDIDAVATPNVESEISNSEQAIAGTQITDVQYRSAAGATMTVVFETSATGVLNAIVTLPNRPKMMLSAPEGQGNNPTYRSNDGSIELISHGGGGSIDLMQDGKLTSFDAVTVEAEVITQS